MKNDKLLEFIHRLKDNLLSFKDASEIEIRERIISPVLERLGWKDQNWRSEYPLGKGKVDYGLLISQRRNPLQCIIEAKAMDVDLGAAESQLLEYAFQEAPPLAILTNGAKWKFYVSTGSGHFRERCVRTLDVERDLSEEICRVLNRYLSYQNTFSGEASKNAKDDLKERITKENIFLAWKKIRSSEKLITMMIEETKLISGYPPQKAYVEELLKNLGDDGPTTEDDREEPDTIKRAFFVLFDKEYEEETPTHAFVKIMEILDERDRSFLQRLAPETKGRKYSWLSKDRTNIGVSLDQKAARKLPSDWWLGTHASTSEKIKRLQKACRIAKIPFGKPEGLKVNFPPASNKSRFYSR